MASLVSSNLSFGQTSEETAVQEFRRSAVVQAAIAAAKRDHGRPLVEEREVDALFIGEACGFAGCDTEYLLAQILTTSGGANPQSIAVTAVVSLPAIGQPSINIVNLMTRPCDYKNIRQIPLWGVVKQVKFWSDKRRSDGNLTEILLTKDEFGGYTAILHIVSARFGGSLGETTEEIATGLHCQNRVSNTDGSLAEVVCERDARPADGVRIQLKFSAVSNRQDYVAVSTKTLPDFLGNGQAEPIVRSIASGLKLEISQ